MAKIADKYFEVNEWKIIEKGFDSSYSEVSESVFSLGNEYMGVRGYFEEGYSKESLIGSYFNGIYEMTEPQYQHYKGIADFTEYMVNSVNWLYTRIEADGELLDLATADIENFVRELDFRTGVLRRSFTWNTKSGKKIEIVFERFLSMTDVETAGQKITFKAIDFDGDIKVTSGLDFSEKHRMADENFWKCSEHSIKTDKSVLLDIEGTTLHTNKKVHSSAVVYADYKEIKELIEEQKVSVEMTIVLRPDEEKSVTKLIRNFAFKDGDNEEEFITKVETSDIAVLSYYDMKAETTKWWSKTWEDSDIVIEGDEENQQGVRFCIFQMFQTYHGAVKGTNIGAKGLTGEAYNGNAFWDTETYCLPFFLLNNKEAAKNLLYFRYKTLDEARNRAKVLDCKGAFFPIATISGKECCNLWQHASLQMQASTAVAYGIWFYEKIFNDREFLNNYGTEILMEISRMLASRGDYSQEGKYGYYCVMGPDEFQMMVNHNCYTNYMAKFTFDYTIQTIEELRKTEPLVYAQIATKINLSEDEIVDWKEKSEKMYIPYDEETHLFEQNEGFFKLPHIDVDSIPIEEFPLYNNWSYERIYRNDMIKQPDILMMMLLFNSKFTQEQLKANYEYYEPRCIHESSLSPSVHSILAAQLHKDEEAYNFFGFATRMDLDNYNRNTREGLHTTSIAAAWMNIVYGFGGLRTDGDEISLSPSIPKDWDKYSFNITYGGDTIKVNVTSDGVDMKTKNGNEVRLKLYDKEVVVNGNGITEI